MTIGRFPDRAAALDFLVEKYSSEDHRARYVLSERDTARVVFTFIGDLGKRKGEIVYVGNGEDLTAAIKDLFKQLKENINDA
jgi:hypothetical protein